MLEERQEIQLRVKEKERSEVGDINRHRNGPSLSILVNILAYLLLLEEIIIQLTMKSFCL